MHRKQIGWILVILWCLMIFYHSHKPAVESSKQSSTIVVRINKSAERITGSDSFKVSETVVRKSAHFLEYFILGIFLCMALCKKGSRPKNLKQAIMMGIAYAITDEIHQHFIPGRAMRGYDVFIDSIGVIAGGYVTYWFMQKKCAPLKHTRIGHGGSVV